MSFPNGATPEPAGRMLRVAMVTPRFPPFMGGTEMHVVEASRRMAAHGYHVEVLTTDPGHNLAEREEFGGVLVRRFRTVPPGGDHFFAPMLARWLTRRRFDLVHMQGAHSLLAPMTMLAAKARGIPYVVTFHTGGHSSWLRRRVRGMQWRVLGPFLRDACGLIAVSQFERRLFAEALGIPEERVRLIPNGAELTVPKDIRERPDLVVSVGRLEWYKGHHRAIDALPALAQLRPDARLRIIGDGPIREGLLERAARLGVADRVSIEAVPPANRLALAEKVAEASIVVLLSEYEAHPVAVTEALALGRRVLLADTSGLSEIAAAGLAVGVPLDIAPQSLASAIDQAMAKAPGVATHRLPTWDDCATAIAGVYRAANCAPANMSVGSPEDGGP